MLHAAQARKPLRRSLYASVDKAHKPRSRRRDSRLPSRHGHLLLQRSTPRTGSTLCGGCKRSFSVTSLARRCRERSQSRTVHDFNEMLSNGSSGSFAFFEANAPSSDAETDSTHGASGTSGGLRKDSESTRAHSIGGKRRGAGVRLESSSTDADADPALSRDGTASTEGSSSGNSGRFHGGDWTNDRAPSWNGTLQRPRTVPSSPEESISLSLLGFAQGGAQPRAILHRPNLGGMLAHPPSRTVRVNATRTSQYTTIKAIELHACCQPLARLRTLCPALHSRVSTAWDTAADADAPTFGAWLPPFTSPRSVPLAP